MPLPRPVFSAVEDGHSRVFPIHWAVTPNSSVASEQAVRLGELPQPMHSTGAPVGVRSTRSRGEFLKDKASVLAAARMQDDLEVAAEP